MNGKAGGIGGGGGEGVGIRVSFQVMRVFTVSLREQQMRAALIKERREAALMVILSNSPIHKAGYLLSLGFAPKYRAILRTLA